MADTVVYAEIGSGASVEMEIVMSGIVGTEEASGAVDTDHVSKVGKLAILLVFRRL